MTKKDNKRKPLAPDTADRLWGKLVAEIAQKTPNIHLMKSLIASGADIDMPNGDGMTPLLQAAMQGKNDAAFLLLDSGADPDKATPQGLSPLILASISGSGGNLPLVKKLLDKNADPNKHAHQTKTAIMWAAHRGFTDIATEIGRRGGDILQKSTGSNPMNAMEWAKDNNKMHTAEKLQRLQERKEQAAAEKKAREEARKAAIGVATAKADFENALQYNVTTHKPLTAPKRASFRKKSEMPGQK